MKKFWMVLGSGTPVYRHMTKRGAVVEAERLARMNPESEFTVLESLATVKRTDISWQSHESGQIIEDEIPF